MAKIISFLRYKPIWLIALLLAVFFTFLLINRDTSSPIKTSSHFIEAVQAGDIDRAYSLTSQNFKKESTKEDLEELTNTVWSLLPQTEPHFAQQMSGKEGTRVVANWPRSDNIVLNLVVLLEEEEGWRVKGANLEIVDGSKETPLLR